AAATTAGVRGQVGYAAAAATAATAAAGTVATSACLDRRAQLAGHGECRSLSGGAAAPSSASTAVAAVAALVPPTVVGRPARVATGRATSWITPFASFRASEE